MRLLLTLVILVLSTSASAQQTAVPDQKLSFDVASVRENKTGGHGEGGDKATSNVPLGPGNIYSSMHGVVSIKNYTLLSYISFAYRMTDAQLNTFRNAAPDWVTHDRFNIEARTDKADVTKDELRLMMRSLLAERFNLAVHAETREVRIFNLTLLKPATPGPRLQQHPEDAPCSSKLPPKSAPKLPPPPETTAAGFPITCGAILLLPGSSETHYIIGGRDITVPMIAAALTSWGALNRPVVDNTGLQGTVDFVLDFARPQAPDAPADEMDDNTSPSFQKALHDQLGLKLDPQKGPVSLIIFDHIDHLIEN